jgi:hypothetical protein
LLGWRSPDAWLSAMQAECYNPKQQNPGSKAGAKRFLSSQTLIVSRYETFTKS